MGTRRILWALGSAMVAVLVIAAIVLGPSLSPRSITPNEPAQEGPPVTVPVWSAGDRWTYRVGLSPITEDVQPASVGLGLFGIVTKTVVGTGDVAGEPAYNVTIAVDLEGLMAAPMEDMESIQVTEARVDGYTWYRADDLAILRDVRTLTLEGQLSTMWKTVNASLTVRTEAVYEPAWDVWAFPIDENESWPVMTNATIRVESMFRLEGTDHFAEIGRNASFVLPISYSMRSGAFDDLTVPAGTFGAMRTTAIHFDVARDDGGMGDLAMLALDEAPRASVDAWFSPEVGNVVRVVAGSSDSTSVRFEAVLVSFARA